MDWRRPEDAGAGRTILFLIDSVVGRACEALPRSLSDGSRLGFGQGLKADAEREA